MVCLGVQGRFDVMLFLCVFAIGICFSLVLLLFLVCLNIVVLCCVQGFVLVLGCFVNVIVIVCFSKVVCSFWVVFSMLSGIAV